MGKTPTSKLAALGLYVDPDTGQVISTHSMLKTMRRCPKQAQYKYVERLKPKMLGRPLRFGTWMHELYEEHHKGGDWKAIHARNTKRFKGFFEEERAELGDLPGDCKRTMDAYLWHYQHDDWKILETEFLLEVELPDGALYRGKVDMLIENEYGLWIVDHKNHKTMPDNTFRLLDAQSALYVWAALLNKYEVQGHIWNYVKSKPPSIPAMLKDGTRLSKSKCDTDYITLLRTIQVNGLNPADYKDWLGRLKAHQYRHGEPQVSSFFQRVVLEKPKGMLKKVAQEAYTTHKRMHSYNWENADGVERVVDRSCTYMCSYTDLCTAELFGGNGEQIRRSQFTQGDPLDYYKDDDPKLKGS